MEHKIKWGEIPLGEELTEEDIQMLLKKLDERAKGCNVFHIDLVPKAVEFVKENVKNAHLIKVSSDTNDGSVWCVIGADEASAKHEWNRI